MDERGGGAGRADGWRKYKEENGNENVVEEKTRKWRRRKEET